MTTVGFQRREPNHPVETPRERAARLKAEASMLAVALRDLDAGRLVPDEELDRWLDAWERGEDVPLPAGTTES